MLDSQRLEARLWEIAIEIRDLDHEKAYVLDANGQVHAQAEGSPQEVWLGLEAMRTGEVTIHNHVATGWGPPSPTDWLSLMNCERGEMRVVSQNWTYSLRVPIGGWTKGQRMREYWTGEKLRYSVRLVDMLQMVPAKIEAEMPQWQSEAQRRLVGSEIMHQAWSAIAREVGSQYSRWPAQMRLAAPRS